MTRDIVIVIRNIAYSYKKRKERNIDYHDMQ